MKRFGRAEVLGNASVGVVVIPASRTVVMVGCDSVGDGKKRIKRIARTTKALRKCSAARGKRGSIVDGCNEMLTMSLAVVGEAQMLRHVNA